jgi:hypothetical protein
VDIKRDGALVAKNRWVISEGGKRLTQEATPVRIDDKNVTNVTEYVRTSGGGNSLIGVWKPVSFEAGEQDLFVVTLIEGTSALVERAGPLRGGRLTAAGPVGGRAEFMARHAVNGRRRSAAMR